MIIRRRFKPKLGSMAEVKAALVEAHRNGDVEAMKRLSQEREFYKHLESKQLKECRCGVRIKKNQKQCRACFRAGPIKLARPKFNFRTGKPSKYVRFQDTGVIYQTMCKTGGNASEAGRILGIAHSTVLKHYSKVTSERSGHRRTLTITPQMCLDALNEHNGCWKKACASLGLLYGTFWRKLRKVYTPAPRKDLSAFTPEVCLAAFKEHGKRAAAAAALGIGYTVFTRKLREVIQTKRSESWNTVKPEQCLSALEQFKDRGKAAAALGIERSTFNKKLQSILPKSRAAVSRKIDPMICANALKQHGTRKKAAEAVGISKSAFARKLAKVPASCFDSTENAG